MLVKIDPLLGANSDNRARAINVMRAIKAVANAAANTTPTCNVISGPSGTLESNQMITVISNETAGGWAVDTNADIGNTYSDSQSSPYNLHLYNDSGKATYPYKAFTLRTNPSYAFNSSFTSYPVFSAYYGCSNSTVWNSGSYRADYSSSDTSYGSTGWQVFDTSGQWSTFNQSYINDARYGSSYYQFPCMWQTGTFYMAATPDYLIFAQTNNYLMYCGTRFTQGWEDSNSDNPPVVSFYFGRWNHPNSVGAWSRLLNTSNTASEGPYRLQSKVVDFNNAPTSYSNNHYHPLHPVSGINRYPGASSQTTYYGDRHAARMFTYQQNSSGQYGQIHPLFYSHCHASQMGHFGGNWSSGAGASYAPVYDSNTALLVPPAVPILFQYYGTQFNPGGRLKGIYKSLSGTNTFISQYASTDQDFSVANSTGGSESHRIIPIGMPSGDTGILDTFLIRKT
jgi:hypothetical protein